MINKIITGISQALHAEFGAGYTTYTESVEQGLKEPCFFIFCLRPTNNRFFAERFRRTHHFMIQYLPATKDVNKECNAVAERLFISLALIDVQGDWTRGMKMSSEITDGVLHFQVNYDMFMYRQKQVENEMGSYNVKTDVREEE